MITRSVSRCLVVLVLPLLVATVFPGQRGQADAQAGTMTFAETGKTMDGIFLDYWKQHGGLAQQGYPISEELQEKNDTDGKIYTVQYFERALFELHSENKAPYDLLLSLLGNFRYKQKYPGGVPSAQAQPNTSPGSMSFSQTGKRLGGRFLDYWRSNGSLSQQGFPISDELVEKSDLDGKSYHVQYFERAVFELHPENKAPYDVLLSQLGTFRYRQQNATGAPQTTLAASGATSLEIKGFNFVPGEVTVAAGTRITWTNKDPSPHTVADPTHAIFSSDVLHTGDTFSFTPTTTGTISYMCTLHPLMRGTIVVK